MFANTRGVEIIVSKFLITFTIMAGATRSVARIKSHCGQLSANGYQNCTIEHNDQSISYIGPYNKTIPGLRFGLITYKCDNVTGYLISDFNCKDCGFHCSAEEHKLERQQENVQFWAGVILSLLLSCVVGGLTGIYFLKFLNARFFHGQHFRRKQANRTDEKVSMTSIDVSESNTEEKLGEASCGEPVADKDVGVKAKSFFPRAKKRMSSFLASLLFVETVSACQWTFLLGHDNLTMVCNGNECQNSPPAAFSVAVGQKVCFEDHFGDVVTLSVNEITYKSRHELVYYTSDYMTVMNEDTCRIECRPACHHTTLLELNEEAKEDSADFHHQGWACDEVSITRHNYYDSISDSSYRDVCCRYYWEAVRISELYPVYTEVGRTWMTNITISQNDSVRQLVLDAYDPSFDLTGFKINTTIRLPLIVANAEVTNSRSAHIRSLLLYGERFYHVEASEVKKPRHGIIGDFQVPVAKDRVIYTPPEKEVCRVPSDSVHQSRYGVSNCSCECNLPRSKISTFASNSSEFTQSDHFVIRNDNSIVDTFEKYVAGNLSLKLGTWKIEDSAVKNAKCNFEYVLSYNCPSCNESSYVVLIPRNVVREGIVPFYSNCSIDRRMLRCDLAEPMKLVLNGRYDTCLVKMPTLRENMLIDVEFKNIRRKIYPAKKVNMTVMTYGETLTHLVTSETFIDAFTKTLIFCSFIFVVVLFGCVSLDVFRSKEKQKEERITDLVL